ncbi:MAG: AraC family transcriptional regulator [Cyanobacteria bacterium SBLK]|nr:AraC family transcriptional regulator [Cyanobacteria bacterium SBLK]
MNKHEIVRLVDRHAIVEGATDTPLQGLQLFRASSPVERLLGVYEPGICAIVQGSKRAYLNGTTRLYNESQYLCCTLPLPVEAEVVEASSEKPLLGFWLSLETHTMLETVMEIAALDSFHDSNPEVMPGLTVAEWDNGFTEALERMLALLDDPVALGVLGNGRIKELMFAVLRGKGGSSICQTFRGIQKISRALTFLRSHLYEPLSIDDLAKQAEMSRAVFHRRFKEITTYSPMQFIKLHRLNDASRLIARGTAVGEAAYRVGYSSQSQFSRDFSRHFGRSPRQWGRTIGSIGGDMLTLETLSTR